MADLYLIAHKVRGEPAFDIAIQMACPECQTYESITGVLCESRKPQEDCHECDQLGYWWIIPTSGHRAYPYWNIELGALMHDTEISVHEIAPVCTLDKVPEMPPSLPDHYPTRAAPTIPLADLLGLRKPKAEGPTQPIHRRF